MMWRLWRQWRLCSGSSREDVASRVKANVKSVESVEIVDVQSTAWRLCRVWKVRSM